MNSTPTRRVSSQPTQKVKVEISLKSVVMIMLLVGMIFLGYKLLQIVIIFFFAFVISSAVQPIVKGLEKRGIGKGLATSGVFLGIILFLTALIMMVFLPFLNELDTLQEQLPKFGNNLVNKSVDLINRVSPRDVSKKDAREILDSAFESNLGETLLPGGVASALGTLEALGSLGGLLTSAFAVFVLSIYIVADHDSVIDLMLLQISDDRKRKLAKRLIADVEGKLGRWLVGQGALSLVIGVLSWVLLTILDVPFALPLAVLAGMLEAIPNIGPIIASVPAIIIALIANGPLGALLVAIGYIIIQQLENIYLVPKIMGNVAGVRPIVVFVSVMIGFTLAGVIGAILAVPTIVLLKLGYEFYQNYHRMKAEGKI